MADGMCALGAFAGAGRVDPRSILSPIFAGCDDTDGSAECLFLAWLMALPREIDPATAARRLLATLPMGRETVAASARISRLVALLEETTLWPRPKLADMDRTADPVLIEGTYSL